MRFAGLIAVGSIAALTALTTSVLAKNSNAPKSDETQQASSSCHARQVAADGTWTDIPCQELGTNARTQAKPVMRSEGEETH